MKETERQSRKQKPIRITEHLLLWLDAILLTVCFIGSYLLRFWSGLFSTYNWTREQHYLIALPILAILYLSCLWFFGGYETRRQTSVAAEAILCLRAVALASLTFLSLVFWYRFFSFSRMVMLMNGAFLIPLSAAGRYMILRGAGYLRKRGVDLANALVIHSTNEKGAIDKSLESHPEIGYRLEHTLTTSEIEAQQNGSGSPLYPLFDKYQINDLFLDLATNENDVALQIIEQCQQEPVRLHFAHRLYRDIRPHPRWRVVDDGDWYTLERTAWDRLSHAIKRAMDVLISIIVLILFSPIMGMIALAIRIFSPGTILFRQERAGLNGRPFTIIKFRSMVEGAENQLDKVMDIESLSQPVFKLKNDPRVTPIGKWLRRFSLDELPQFWNVIRGEMSLVGPRPEELWIVERYDDAIRARLRVKPGITGYQQIRSRGTEDMSVRLNHDLYYIDHQSLFFDIFIILQTLFVVISGKGRI